MALATLPQKSYNLIVGMQRCRKMANKTQITPRDNIPPFRHLAWHRPQSYIPLKTFADSQLHKHISYYQRVASSYAPEVHHAASQSALVKHESTNAEPLKVPIRCRLQFLRRFPTLGSPKLPVTWSLARLCLKFVVFITSFVLQTK